MTPQEVQTAVREKRFTIVEISPQEIEARRAVTGHADPNGDAAFFEGRAVEAAKVPADAKRIEPHYDWVSGALRLLFAHTTFSTVAGDEGSIPIVPLTEA